VRGASGDDMAAVQQYSCNGTAAQQFLVSPSPAGAGIYTLVNANSGKCLDVQGFSQQPGARLQQYSCTGTTAQQFWIRTTGPGRYEFANVNSGQCVDVPSFSNNDGVQLQQYTCTGTNAQAFSLIQLDTSVLPLPPTSPPQVLKHEYDAQGNPTATVQAPDQPGFNFVTTSRYDPLNRVKESVDAKAGSTRFQYDGQDRVTLVTDPMNLATQYERTGLGETTRLISPDTGISNQTFDAAGNLKTRTDSRGVLASYDYDAKNRLTRATYSKAGLPAQEFTWTYDLQGAYGRGVGHLTRMDHAAGLAQFVYADTNDEVTVSIQTFYPVAGVNDAVIQRVDYEYDAGGRLVGITYPSGRKVVLGYTVGAVNGLVTSVGLAPNAASAALPLISQIQWEPFGQGILNWQWHMASSIQSHERLYDQAGRTVRYPLGDLVRDLRYDEAGRIKSYTHRSSASGAAANSWDQAFAYDEVGRLTQVLQPGTAWSIAYDANGNRTSVSLNGSTSQYNTVPGSNKLAGTTNPVRTFAHDEAGNVKTDTGKGYAASYDLSGRLSTISVPSGTMAYTYDNFGQRIRKSGNAGTVLFMYGQDGQLLGEYDGTGKAIREYVWLGSTPVAIFTPDPTNAANPPLVYYVHADHLDAPRVVAERSTGKTRWRWMAEPFGTSAPETNPQGLGAFTQNLRFPGQYFDQESGLFYNYFRNYDSSTGRYTQSDTIGLLGGINTYAYVGGNPLSHVDPDGQFFFLLVPAAEYGAAYLLGDAALFGGAAWWTRRPATKYAPSPSRPMESRASGEEKLPIVNPGRDCDGNCNPCPPGKKWFVPKPGHGHDNGYWHTIVYNQDKRTCTCYPDRPSGGLDGL